MVNMKLHIFTAPQPGETESKTQEGLGDSKVACPHRAMDELDHLWPELTVYQELEDVLAPHWCLIVSVKKTVTTDEARPLRVEG